MKRCNNNSIALETGFSIFCTAMLLAAGLIIGYLRSHRPTFGRLPDAAQWILMELGLLLFMAGVGLRAGGNIIQTLQTAGPMLILIL